MNVSDYYVSLSGSISMKDCQLMVAYTHQGEYHLLVFKKDAKYELHPLKVLTDIDHSSSPLHSLYSWFKSKEVRRYNNVRLFPLRLDKKDEFIRILVIRDNLVSLHLVYLHLQTRRSMISLTNKATSIAKIVPNSAVLL